MAQLTRWLREQQKKFLVVILVVIVITWTLGSALMRMVEPTRVRGGEIYGKEVSGKTVRRYALPLMLVLPSAAKQGTLTGHAWETLMLLEEASRLGIQASPAEVQDWLRMRFRDAEGNFSPAEYQSQLSYVGVAPGDFERVLSDRIAVQRAIHAVRSASSMSRDEAWLWWARDNVKVKVRYAFLAAGKLEPFVKVTEEEVLRQYESGKNVFPKEAPGGVGYKLAERIKMEYVLVPFAPHEKAAVITERQIRKHYEANKERYRIRTPDQDKKVAKPKYRSLQQVIPEIEKDLRREEAKRIAEEMRRDISRDIEKQLDVPFGSTEERVADMKAIAGKHGVQYIATDWFTADEVRKVLPGAWSLSKQAFGQGMGFRNQPRDVDAADGLVVYQVTDIKLPMPAALAEVRAKVEEHARKRLAFGVSQEIVHKASLTGRTFEEVVQAVEKRIAGLAAEAGKAQTAKVEEAATKDDKKLDEKGAKKGTKDKAAEKEEKALVVGESKYFSRPRGYPDYRTGETRFYAYGTGIPGGNRANVAGEAFRLQPKGVGVAAEPDGNETGAYLLALDGTKRPERAEFDKEPATTYEQILVDKRELALVAWRNDVLRRARPSQTVLAALYSLGYWGKDSP